MIGKLLANPYAGNETEHPDMHLIYVDKFVDCLSLQVYPDRKWWKRFSLYLWREKHWHGIGYVMILDHGIGIVWKWSSTKKNYPMHLVHRDRNYIYIIFGLVKEKVSLKLGGGLISPNFVDNPVIKNFLIKMKLLVLLLLLCLLLIL